MTVPGKRRLDLTLVERGLIETREKARAVIMAGSVMVNGRKASKAGESVTSDAVIQILDRLRYVGRGGLKLEAALDRFALSVLGSVCLDVGSSTGGFTDCLLQRGALRVHAVDVGKGQLDWKLRNDPRVVIHEGVNARYLAAERIGEPVSLAVCDVSFISVTLILPRLPGVLTGSGAIVILVKPQFEVGRREVGKGGIVRDPEAHRAACERVESAARKLGYATALMESPVLGAEGNKEFLLYAHR